MDKPWPKVPTELAAWFDGIVPDAPGVERRKMFGCPCAFVHGQMFLGLFQESLFLRLSEGDRAELLSHDEAAVFEPMPGRPMREYVTVPEGLLPDHELSAWIERARTYAASLPPKPPKPLRKKRT